jgi:Holliday junction DNA helicase RuvA
VREDALDLYGFESQGEVALFQQFISISGIGPKSGLSIMNLADEHTLRTAIASGDTAYLTRVSGIGKKIAEKVVLELKDKMIVSGDASPLAREDGDVLQALEALGYGRSEAREALKRVPKEAKGTNERLKETLKILGRG